MDIAEEFLLNLTKVMQTLERQQASSSILFGVNINHIVDLHVPSLAVLQVDTCMRLDLLHLRYT